MFELFALAEAERQRARCAQEHEPGQTSVECDANGRPECRRCEGVAADPDGQDDSLIPPGHVNRGTWPSRDSGLASDDPTCRGTNQTAFPV